MTAGVSQRLLVTGKDGQVGRELVNRAVDCGVEVIAFNSKELDIRDREAVLVAVLDSQATVVINAAAYTAVDKAEEEEALVYDVNCNGVENLALACRAQNIPLIHISTDYVFDGEKDFPYVESDKPNPIGVYGASKYAGEEVLRKTWAKHIILRVSWVFGVHGQNFVETMLHLAADRDEISVVNDQFGAPTSASDIARVLLNMVLEEKIDFGLYHLESNPKVSWYDFAQKIFKEARELALIDKVPVVSPMATEGYPTPVQRPKNSKLATNRNSLPVNWEKALSKMLFDMAASKEIEQ